MPRTAVTAEDQAWLRETLDAIELEVRRFADEQGVKPDAKLIQTLAVAESVKHTLLMCRALSRRIAALEKRSAEG